MEIASSNEDHDSDESFEFKSCVDDQIDLQEGLLFSSEAALSDDDDSYIEIALEHNSSNDEDQQDLGERDETEEEDLNLRISFSSRSYFQQEATKVYTLNTKQHSGRFPNCELKQKYSMGACNNSPYASSCPTTHSSSSSSSSSSSALNNLSNCNTGSSSVRSSEDVPGSPKGTSRWLSTQLPAVKKMLNMLLLSLRESSEGKVRSDQNRHSASQASSSDWKLVVQSTKNTSSVTGSINGKIMKFFIKFKSVNVQSMLSNVKTPKSTMRAHTSSSTTPYNGRRKLRKTGSNGKRDLLNGDSEKSRSMEINMDAFKGVIEAMGMNFCRKDRKNAQAKSCPGWTKSSPIQPEKLQNKKTYRRENSIQGAIAHCKRSLDETPGFSS